MKAFPQTIDTRCLIVLCQVFLHSKIIIIQFYLNEFDPEISYPSGIVSGKLRIGNKYIYIAHGACLDKSGRVEFVTGRYQYMLTGSLDEMSMKGTSACIMIHNIQITGNTTAAKKGFVAVKLIGTIHRQFTTYIQLVVIDDAAQGDQVYSGTDQHVGIRQRIRDHSNIAAIAKMTSYLQRGGAVAKEN